MRKILMCFVALLAIAAAATGPARAQSTSSLVFEASCGGSGTADDNVQWTVTSDGTESNYDGTKGIHYGTGQVSVQYIELSTSGITGTITQVKVNASTASGVTATVGVTVGGNAFGGDPQSLSTTATNYTFTGSASGAIVVRVAKPSAAVKALYVKSIEVTYTPASSGGGSNRTIYGIPEGWSVTANGQSVTVSGDSAIVPEGAAVLLIPPLPAKPLVSNVTLEKVIRDPNEVPLTLEALTAGNIQVNIGGTLTTGMKYSVNDGEKNLINTTTTIDVAAGDKVQFYGNGTSTQNYGNNPVVKLQGSAQTKVYGNIMSLLDEDNFATLTALPNSLYVFRRLFYGNANLTDASGLLLPATTLANRCYQGMFQNCSTLTAAPALPATTMTNECYASMFNGCSSLTAAPALPATTLNEACYNYMFKGCSGLTSAPVLPATTLAQYCYYAMFQNCSTLTAAPELPATTLVNSCYREMFSGCSSLTAAPELPATTLVDQCYYKMFQGCSNLNSVTCPATTLVNYSTTNWLDGVAATGTFYADPSTNWTTNSPNGIPTGWTRVDPNTIVPLTMEALTAGNIQVNINGNLSSGMKYSVNGGAKNLINNPTTIDVAAGDKVQFYGNGTSTQVYGNNPGVRLLGTAQTKVYGNIMSLLDEDNFATLTALPSQGYVFYGLFFNNANLTDASGLLLPATTLANYCYSQMFYGCSSLTAAPALPATTLANNCYSQMFYGCSSLTAAPALPATMLAEGCYASMFQNCISLTAAPALPATTLANYCYYNMFKGCSNLNSVTCLATDITASSCTSNWLSSVAATGTFYANPSTNWGTGPTGIPTGWTRVDPNAIIPLTMEALTAGNIQVNMNGTLTTGMKYSVNGGAKNLINTTTTIDVAAGDKVQFYGNGTSTQVYGNTPEVKLLGTAQTKVYGNIMSLLDEDNFATLTALPSQGYVFYGLFYGNANLTDASGLRLPATTLADNCYENMFNGCGSLTSAPALPATTLAEACYSQMFYGCSSLTAAPVLPATTLANYCYYTMFRDCGSLTAAPELPAPTLVNSCYRQMFQGCSNLNSVTCLATTINASQCTTNWLLNVAATGTLITPASTNWGTGATGIPSGWTRQTP